ncbi:MAG: SPOR domain-containing protein [Bacteroidetes bacterium]|nr:SPOR domain-containing protein [Bacteroidota bacterium]
MSWMISIGQVPEKGGKPVPSSYCLSPIEYKLYNMINDYRQRYDLPPVPLSKSLCFVAATHAKDLFIHHPDQGPCKQYSWSDQGFWKPFCYPRDENKKNSVWDKPKELTTYKGKGYEITYWENSEVVIDSIMTLWKSMDYFNAFLMNTGKWQGRKWNAIGIGIYENYACAWFGELSDPEGEPFICGQEPRKPGSTPVVKATPPEKKVPETKKVQEAKVPADKKAKEAAATSTGSEASTVPGNEYYYIIVKGIAPEKELQRFLKDLQSKGYSSAKLLEKNGKQRVSIMGFPDKSKADSALRQVKKSWPDAWILKQ